MSGNRVSQPTRLKPLGFEGLLFYLVLKEAISGMLGSSHFVVGETDMTLGTILLVILVLLLIGALPNWGYSRGWGRGPAGLLGVVLIVVLILVLLGRI